MAVASFASYQEALKRQYADKIEDITLPQSALLAMLPKVETAGGNDIKVPLRTANPQGISRDFPTAYSIQQASSGKFYGFDITWTDLHVLVRVPDKAIMASRANESAFIEVLRSETDGVLKDGAKRLGIHLYGDGYGGLGAVGSTTTVGSTTLTLSKKSDAIKFSEGQRLDVSATNTGAVKAYGSSGNALIVTGVDAVNGTLTFAYNLNDGTNGIPTIAVGDVIFAQGDHDGSNQSLVAGLSAWITTPASSGDSFFGVNRYVNSQLYGMSLTGVGDDLITVIKNADMNLNVQGGVVSHVFMHPANWNNITDQLGGKVQYVDSPVTARVSFKTVEIAGMGGQTIKLVPDRYCPPDKLYCLELDSWKLYSMGKAINPFDIDTGNTMMRSPDAAGIDFRARFYGNLACSKPGHNAVVTVSNLVG